MAKVLSQAPLDSGPQTRVHGLFIDGKEVPASGDELLDVLNPSTGEVLARIGHATNEDVDCAVLSARRAFESREVGKPQRAFACAPRQPPR